MKFSIVTFVIRIIDLALSVWALAARPARQLASPAQPGSEARNYFQHIVVVVVTTLAPLCFSEILLSNRGAQTQCHTKLYMIFNYWSFRVIVPIWRKVKTTQNTCNVSHEFHQVIIGWILASPIDNMSKYLNQLYQRTKILKSKILPGHSESKSKTVKHDKGPAENIDNQGRDFLPLIFMILIMWFDIIQFNSIRWVFNWHI